MSLIIYTNSKKIW